MNTGHVDSVEIDVDGGPSEHGHDGRSVLFFDFVLENDLVRESNSSLPRILPSKDTRASAHRLLQCQSEI